MKDMWQPIETAPKDGTAILICWDWGSVMVVGFYGAAHDLNQTEECWRLKFDHRDVETDWTKPTHWMPLPEPPKE